MIRLLTVHIRNAHNNRQASWLQAGPCIDSTLPESSPRNHPRTADSQAVQSESPSLPVLQVYHSQKIYFSPLFYPSPLIIAVFQGFLFSAHESLIISSVFRLIFVFLITSFFICL